MEERLTRLAVAIACMMTAALLALGAVGLLAAALYLALLPVVAPPLAAALTAAAALLLALIVVVIGRTITRRPVRRAPPGSVGASAFGRMGVVGGLGQEMGQQAGEFARANAGKAIIAALVAGFAVGVSPRLRRSLWQLLQ